MERTPKRIIVIDPRHESVNINGEYLLSLRQHGKRCVVNVERIGAAVVLTVEKLDNTPPTNDTSVTT